jgi:putative oxidoreductase
MSSLRSAEPVFRSLLRLVVGFTFSCHGWQKLFGLFGGMHPPLLSLFGVAGVIETVGGALIFLGLFTGPVAFICSGEMAVAFFKMHFPHGFLPLKNGGELAVVYCFFFLFLVFAGAGPISLDGLLRKKGN